MPTPARPSPNRLYPIEAELGGRDPPTPCRYSFAGPHTREPASEATGGIKMSVDAKSWTTRGTRGTEKLLHHEDTKDTKSLFCTRRVPESSFVFFEIFVPSWWKTLFVLSHLSRLSRSIFFLARFASV